MLKIDPSTQLKCLPLTLHLTNLKDIWDPDACRACYILLCYR